jgi:hypothetical protein
MRGMRVNRLRSLVVPAPAGTQRGYAPAVALDPDLRGGDGHLSRIG